LNNINYVEFNNIFPDFRFKYLLNFSINKINTLSNLILVGTNPRVEAPLFDLYIQKMF